MSTKGTFNVIGDGFIARINKGRMLQEQQFDGMQEDGEEVAAAFDAANEQLVNEEKLPDSGREDAHEHAMHGGTEALHLLDWRHDLDVVGLANEVGKEETIR